MPQKKIGALSSVVAKYANLESLTWPSSLGDDFKQVLKLAPDKPLAHALKVAFRAPETPSFASIVAALYGRSNERRFRLELLKTVLAQVPSLSMENWPELLSPEDTDKISFEQVADFLSVAERSQPAVVDVVSTYYVRSTRRALLSELDRDARGLILKTLATTGEIAGRQVAGSIVEEVEAPSMVSRSKTDLPEAAEHLSPAPIPRYAAVQIFRESSPKCKGGELDKDQPLRSKDWYQFEISVGPDPKGVAAAEQRRPIREPKQKNPVEILVTAKSDTFEIEQPVSMIVLPQTGKSTKQAMFRVQPTGASSSAAELHTIEFKLYYKLNLLEQFSVHAEVVGSFDDDTASKFGLYPPIELRQRMRQSDSNDFDLITPASLNISIEQHAGKYQLTFTLHLDSPKPDKLAFVTNVSFNSDQLESTIAGVRKTLFKVCSSDTLNKGVDGLDWEFQEHLQELYECGTDLWALLFDPIDGEGPAVVGKWLRENPPPDGSKIQVSIDGTASTFTFPWSLLYDRPYRYNSPPSEQGFWGMRYVVEQTPTTHMRSTGSNSSENTELEIGALYWKFDETPAQQTFLLDLLQQAKKIKLALGKPIDERDVAHQYLANCSSQIIYFFTHGYTGLPDGERFGITIEDFTRLWEKQPAAFRDATKYVFENIEKKQYKSDESFIELTSGRLMLKRLFKEVQKLPMEPLVILNMCDSAQVTPSLKQSFIDFFLSRGARAVIGTECSMRPVFADFVGRRLLKSLFQAEPIGEALRKVRIEAASRKNLLGLAYTLFGTADASLEPRLLP